MIKGMRLEGLSYANKVFDNWFSILECVRLSYINY